MKEKARARREKIRELAKVVAAMTEQDRVSLAQRTGIRTIEGHELSVFNHCLLLTQNPNLSIVGGFRQWKKAGRSVMKGQHGLAIWCPVKPKATPDADELEGDQDGEKSKPRFMLGTVFDISQTRDGTAKPLDEEEDENPERESLAQFNARQQRAVSSNSSLTINPQVEESDFQLL